MEGPSPSDHTPLSSFSVTKSSDHIGLGYLRQLCARPSLAGSQKPCYANWAPRISTQIPSAEVGNISTGSQRPLHQMTAALVQIGVFIVCYFVLGPARTRFSKHTRTCCSMTATTRRGANNLSTYVTIRIRSDANV